MQFTLLRNLQLGLSLQPNAINISSVQSWHRCLLSRDLLLRINNTTDDQQQQQLKWQHNSVLHAMRRKALANASVILDERAAEVERLHDGARIICAVRLLCCRPHLQAVVHDEHGHTVEDPVEVGRRVTEYSGQQFRDDVGIGLPASGKPIGALSSLRPIVLLTSLHKVLSLVVLAWISSKVNSYPSAGHSGFRNGRSTADIVFGYRPGTDEHSKNVGRANGLHSS